MKKLNKLKTLYSHLKINKQLLGICIVALVVNLAIAFVIMNYISSLYSAVAKKQIDTSLKLANNNIETEFSRVEGLLNDIYIDENIQTSLNRLTGDFSLDRKVDAYRSLEQRISEYIGSFFYVRSISVYDTTGKKRAGTQGYDRSMDMQHLVEDAVLANGQNIWCPVGEGKVVLCRALHMSADRNPDNVAGVVSVHIDIDRMIHFLGILQDAEFKLLVFKDNLTLYESEENLGKIYWQGGNEDTFQIGGDHYLASRQKSAGIDFEYVMFTNLENYDAKFTQILLLMFLLLFVEVLMYGLMTATISNVILKPIASVGSSIKFAVSNDFEVLPERKYEIGEQTENEVYLLYNSFYDMLVQLNTLIIENYKTNIEKCNIELEMLYSQINPHFLYNALDTVYWLAVQSGNDKIAEMVMALSTLFRSAINDKENVVKLTKEFKLVEQYLSIQKIRFEDRLSVHIDISPEVMSCDIPKLIIQPVVENSIKHVLDNTTKTCEIDIRAYREQDNLIVEVADNGPMICEGYKNDIHTANHGMGIKNITRRIKLACGEKGKVLFEIEETQFRTRLILPLEQAGGEGNV